MYYHNVTKNIWNESDLIDFMENYENGDVILTTDFGNATIKVLDMSEINELCKEYLESQNETEEY